LSPKIQLITTICYYEQAVSNTVQESKLTQTYLYHKSSYQEANVTNVSAQYKRPRQITILKNPF